MQFDQAELQSLGDAIFQACDRADCTSQDYVIPALRALSNACLSYGWDQRKYINKLKDRLSIRDQQLRIAEEKSTNQDKLFQLGNDKHRQQNTNIRILEARCKELQRQCESYKEILEQDVKIFTKSTIDEIKN